MSGFFRKRNILAIDRLVSGFGFEYLEKSGSDLRGVDHPMSIHNLAVLAELTALISSLFILKKLIINAAGNMQRTNGPTPTVLFG